MSTVLSPVAQGPVPSPVNPDPKRYASRWLIEHASVTTILKQVCGVSKKSQTFESLRSDVAAKARELAGPDPTPIEESLAMTAAVCWFAWWCMLNNYANAAGRSIAQAEFDQRRLTAAHQRFLASVKTLAQVRKLALPAIQVNVGANQVNALVASKD